MKDGIGKLIQLCQGRPVYVQTHNFPDPDALAAGYGISRLLECFEIHTTLCYDGKLDKRACKKMTEVFQIRVTPLRRMNLPEENAVLICVDGQRGNGNIRFVPVETVACIDHHPVTVEGHYAYQDIRAVGSCCAIVAEYFRDLGIEPDENTASALLYGIQVDTRQFTRGVSDLDIDMFRFLNRLANGELLRKFQVGGIAIDDLKAYASAIENLQIYERVGITEVEFPCSNDIIAMISDFFLSLEEIDLAVVYSIRRDGIKFSVRSELNGVDAGAWVKKALDGYGSAGGHPYMAGGLIEPDQAEKLGMYPRETIRDLFLNTLAEIAQELPEDGEEPVEDRENS